MLFVLPQCQPGNPGTESGHLCHHGNLVFKFSHPHFLVTGLSLAKASVVHAHTPHHTQSRVLQDKYTWLLEDLQNRDVEKPNPATHISYISFRIWFYVFFFLFMPLCWQQQGQGYICPHLCEHDISGTPRGIFIKSGIKSTWSQWWDHILIIY